MSKLKIFDRIFSKSSQHKEPDNSKLLQLLDIYWKADGKGNTYKQVVLELMNGNSYLLLPGTNEVDERSTGWATAKENVKITMSSVFNLDGLKALAAFTDEKALLDWSKQPCQYTSLRSQAVLELCEANNIARIVINNNSGNTFVLERNRTGTKEYSIKAKDQVILGTPATPIDKSLLEKMIGQFRYLSNIKRVYHYGQTKGKEFSLVLAFDLEKYSENGKKAVIDLVRDAIGNELLPCPLDVFFIESLEWRHQITAIKGALVYEA